MEFRLGYNSYEEASLRKATSITLSDRDDRHLFSLSNILPLISSGTSLTFKIVGPYVAPLIAVHFYYSSSSASRVVKAVEIGGLVYIAKLFIRDWLVIPTSPINSSAGTNSFGASVQTGLHISKPETFFRRVLERCPNLNNSSIADGVLTHFPTSDGKKIELRPTPWMLSGDIRTLLPFFLFQPKGYRYERRWIRVPLASGPRTSRNKDILDSCNGMYEAVALDCAIVSPGIRTALQSDRFVEQKDCPDYVYLLLAGLTGGSNEGYILDFVHSATARGHDCFVMLGRGLGDTPCSSKSLFHGARTSDFESVANHLRTILPSHVKIFAVGISMGGIIICNAVARGDLRSISGAVSLGGCFDCELNMAFQYSRTVWQPLLTFGLKQAFATTLSNLELMSKRFGLDAKAVIARLVSIVDFDSVVVTKLHGFGDVIHYYDDMCAASRKQAMSVMQENGTGKFEFNVPLLAIHAADDPIIHVDTMYMTGKPNSENSISMINFQNLVCLVTSKGGHVGWPLGWAPWRYRWAFQNTLVWEFCSALNDELNS